MTEGFQSFVSFVVSVSACEILGRTWKGLLIYIITSLIIN